MPTNPNMVAIQTVTVGSGGAASISFTSIPQTYTDLYVVISARCDESSIAFGQLYVAPNNATTNLSSKLLYGYGSGTGSAGYTTFDSVWTYIASDGATASTFGNASFYFPNYTSSNNKSISIDGVNENNATDARQGLTAGLWSSSSAITSLYFYVLGNAGASRNFKQYSTATLYGVTSAGYGAKATGGIITQDANYYYHTFFASGTFTPTSNITADYLVVAGGGGGGFFVGGGGGAGGLRCTVTATGGGGSLESALSLTASTNYTVTVGAGGAGASSAGNGTSGSNSVFSSITSTGGGGGGGASSGAAAGSNGGSGGGAGGSGTASGGTGTANQGYAGASITTTASGGGGGAGQAGGTGGVGNGGNGVATSISGTSVTYAGGGAGRYSSGTAGTGGGGSASSRNGTANLGGGGAGDGGGEAGGAGGSGIVIVRYAK